MSSINFYRLAQTHEEIQALLNKIEENYSITLEQYLDLLSTDSRLSELVTQKVHQIPGKGLSTEDFETRFKDVLIEILNQGGIKPIIHNTKILKSRILQYSIEGIIKLKKLAAIITPPPKPIKHDIIFLFVGLTLNIASEPIAVINHVNSPAIKLYNTYFMITPPYIIV